MIVTDIPTEKRSFPRAASYLRVSDVAAPKNRLTLLDFGEGGLRFDSAEPIARPSVSLRLSFPHKKSTLTADTKFVWEKLLETGGSRYGVEFIGMDEKAKIVLRTELIKSRIEGLLNDIRNREARRDVSHFFLKDFADYMDKVAVLTSEASARGGHSRELQDRLERLNTTILLKGYSLELLVADKSVMRRVKETFRSLIGTWVYKSCVMKRAFEKPRAYPSDFRMLEMIYQNCPLSNGVGEYFDTYFLNNPDAVAIRSRKGRLREILHKFIIGSMQKRSIRILDVACGSCREIVELIGEMEHHNPLTLTCMDWDEEALDFSRALLKNVPANVKVEFLKANLMDIVKGKEDAPWLGGYDLIYNIGLTDYLPDMLLKKCLQFYGRCLSEGGVLLLTHKNQKKTFPPIPAQWFCDWESIPRSKSELTALLSEALPGFDLNVATDDFGYIYYFTLVKKEDRTVRVGNGAQHAELALANSGTKRRF